MKAAEVATERLLPVVVLDRSEAAAPLARPFRRRIRNSFLRPAR